jgi:hypothetical protein
MEVYPGAAIKKLTMKPQGLRRRLEAHSGKIEAQLGAKGFHPAAIKAQPGYFESEWHQQNCIFLILKFFLFSLTL